MGEEKQGNGLARFLARQDEHGRLPQMILYNLNPADNDLFAVLAGAFQGTGRCAGHVQWGSAWWFLDQEQGIRRHLDDLSNYGLLSTFVGMLTDSHSPLSFVRHEMFRRILCDVIGHDAESGRIPQDIPMLQDLVRRVCFDNSKNYFGFSLHPNFT
jgi:glucuronate isomerase